MALRTADGATGKVEERSIPKIVKLPDEVQPEVRALINKIRDYKGATNWSEIDAATSVLDEDAVYDSPFMYITGGRDRVRAVAKLLSPFAYTEFEPKVVRIGINNSTRMAELELDGTLRVNPRRYWFLPLTLFLPSIPIEGTVGLRVKSWNDKVSRVEERFFNLPNFVPVAFRWLAGFTTGTFGAITEPVLLQLWEWYKTGYATVEQGAHQVISSEPVSAALDKAAGVKDTITQSVVNPVVDTVTGAVTPVVDTVKGVAMPVVDTVKGVAVPVVENVKGRVAGLVPGSQ